MKTLKQKVALHPYKISFVSTSAEPKVPLVTRNLDGTVIGIRSISLTLKWIYRKHVQQLSLNMNQSLLVSRSLRLGTALQRHRYYRDLRVSFSTDEKEIQPEEKVSIQDFLKNIAATENIKPENFLYTREIVMPDMGEGKGRVTKWFKDEGEIVRRGDVLCGEC